MSLQKFEFVRGCGGRVVACLTPDQKVVGSSHT